VSAWSLRTVARAIVVAATALGVGAGLGRWVAHEPVAPRAQPLGGGPAADGSPERALVAPLRPGARLADFSIDFISSTGGGVFVVGCMRGQEGVRLVVALDGGPVSAPASAAGYAIYYLADHASGARDDDGVRLAQALAEIVGRNGGAPRPPGLQRFTAESR
jgi:hypothetical protein